MTDPKSEPIKPEPFEMRRLESLSNTIFGVAMTLLAYDLPKANFAGLPNWDDLYRLYSGRLVGLILSFVIAGVFWISHHRRLARQPEGSRGLVMLNLFFLLSIVLLPVTNGLYGNYTTSSAVGVLYGSHLTIIAILNAVLWRLAPHETELELLGALIPVLAFIPGTIVAAFAPHYAPYFWFLGFSGLFARYFVRAKAGV